MQKDTNQEANTNTSRNALWEEHIDPKTGESSLKTHTLTKISRFDTCDHYFIPVDSGRSVQCKHCGFGQPFILGKQKLVKGKIKPV